MKMRIRTLLIVLPLALVLIGGIMTRTSGTASAHSFTSSTGSLQGVATTRSASASKVASNTQGGCSWWSIPNAPSMRYLVVQSVAHPQWIAAMGDISAGPPVAVFYIFNGALPWSVVQYNAPGFFLSIYIGYQTSLDQRFNVLSAWICSDWQVSYYP